MNIFSVILNISKSDLKEKETLICTNKIDSLNVAYQQYIESFKDLKTKSDDENKMNYFEQLKNYFYMNQSLNETDLKLNIQNVLKPIFDSINYN